MNFGDFCCLAIIAIIIGCIIWIFVSDQQDKYEKKRQEEENRRKQEQYKREEEAREREREKQAERGRYFSIVTKLENCELGFEQFWREPCGYWGMYSSWKEVLRDIEHELKTFQYISIPDDFTKRLNMMKQRCNLFTALGYVVQGAKTDLLIDNEEYGQMNSSVWNKIKELKKADVDIRIRKWENMLHECTSADKIVKKSAEDIAKQLSHADMVYRLYGGKKANDKTENVTVLNNDLEIFGIQMQDIEELPQLIWFYAIQRPYNPKEFSNAKNIFLTVNRSTCISVELSELYALKQLGGEDAIRDRVEALLADDSKDYPHKKFNAKEIELLASGLMWMKAYKMEQIVLQSMLEKGMPMSEKAQKRLHALASGGGKTPVDFDIDENSDKLYFNVSSLSWREEDYIGLFDNLAFQDKKLNYALAVRDEDKDLFASQGIKIPDVSVRVQHIKTAFAEEYDDDVLVKEVNCVSVYDGGEEEMSCVFAQARDIMQMGILVHIVKIGKKLNIKFYTLFIPQDDTSSTQQKQQVLSLHNKLNHSASMWESSMKNTILVAIQQMLNEETGTSGEAEPNKENNETIEF